MIINNSIMKQRNISKFKHTIVFGYNIKRETYMHVYFISSITISDTMRDLFYKLILLKFWGHRKCSRDTKEKLYQTALDIQ